MLGMNKWFVAFLLLSIAIGYGTKNWMNGAVVLAWFVLIRIIWKFLTK